MNKNKQIEVRGTVKHSGVQPQRELPYKVTVEKVGNITSLKGPGFSWRIILDRYVEDLRRICTFVKVSAFHLMPFIK